MQTGTMTMAARLRQAITARHVLIAIVAVLLAGVSLIDAIVRVVGRTNPAAVLLIRPQENSAALRLANTRLGVAMAKGTVPDADDAAAIAATARRVIAADPASATAFAVLGAVTMLRGDSEAAAPILAQSNRLWRRNPTAQFLLFQIAGRQGNVRDASRHLDQMLSTNVTSRGIMFPILLQAIADERTRKVVGPVLDRNPEWALPFYVYAIDNAKDPRPLAQLMSGRRALPQSPGTPVAQSVLVALSAAGQLEEAGRLLRSMPGGEPGFTGATVRDPAFLSMGRREPFDWAVAGDYDTSLEQVKGGGLSFSTMSGWQGTLIRQALLLPPGRYRLESRHEMAELENGTVVQWRLYCATGGQPLAQLIEQQAGGGPRRLAADLTVPAGCTSQWLLFEVVPGREDSAAEGRIDRVEVLRRGS